MFHVWSGWRNGMSVFSIPLSWFKAVTNFLNHFAAGTGIEIEKPENPGVDAPVKIRLSQQVLETIEGLKTTKAPAETDLLPSGYQQTLSPSSKDQSTFTAGSMGGNGITLYVLCRAATDGDSCILHFRPMVITSDGRIQKVQAEIDAVSVFENT